MKKILSIFILVLSVFLLTSCELNSFFTTKGKITTKSNTSSSEVTNSSSQTTKSSQSSSSNSSSSKSTIKKDEEIEYTSIGKFENKTVSTINLLSINDTHGQLDGGTNANGYHIMSLAEMDGTFNYLEEENNQKYIRIMAGDLFQGSFVSRMTYGYCMIEALNAADFDVMILGNHEFDWGLDKVREYFDGDKTNGEANFPLLCCNIVDLNTGERPDWIKPYAVIDYYGINVGIIGAIGEGIESTVTESQIKNKYEFTEELPLVKQYAKELWDLGCDTVIYVCHDYANNGQTFRTIAESISSTQYIDAFIAGHTHQQIEEYYSRADGYKIPLIQSYTKNGSFGTIELNWNGSKVTSGTMHHYNSSASCVRNSEATQDVQDIINSYQDIITLGDEVVYHLNSNLNSKQAIGDYMMDAMASYIKNNENVSGVKEVYAFLNTGGIRVSSQAAGDLTFADIYEWFPFDNRVVYIVVNGSKLESFYESHKGYVWTSNFSSFEIESSKTYIIATSDYCEPQLRSYGTVHTIDVIMYNMLREYLLSLK